MNRRLRKKLKLLIGKEMTIKILFTLKNNYWPNLKEPKTFNEKIQYRKLYGDNYFYSNYADKVSFREIIKKTIGEEYLVPIHGIYNRLTEKDWNSLPEKFVIKASHGSGERFIEIVKEKKKCDFHRVKKKFEEALKIDFGEEVDELFYSIKDPKIIIEKFIETKSGNEIEDYKFHCFNHKKEMCKLFLQLDYDRSSGHKKILYDEDFNCLPMEFNVPNGSKRFEEPENYEKMKELAKKISKKFNYARVDFFNVQGKIYVGELTFCPAGGFGRFSPKEWDHKWGNYWDLKDENIRL